MPGTTEVDLKVFLLDNFAKIQVRFEEGWEEIVDEEMQPEMTIYYEQLKEAVAELIIGQADIDKIRGKEKIYFPRVFASYNRAMGETLVAIFNPN